MCESQFVLFYTLILYYSCRNANTGSVVDTPGLKPNSLSLMFIISLSLASMIRSQFHEETRQLKILDSPVKYCIRGYVTFVF